MIDEAKCLGSIEVRRVEASALSPDNVNHQSQTLEVQINLFPYQSNAERTRDKEDVSVISTTAESNLKRESSEPKTLFHKSPDDFVINSCSHDYTREVWVISVVANRINVRDIEPICSQIISDCVFSMLFAGFIRRQSNVVIKRVSDNLSLSAGASRDSKHTIWRNYWRLSTPNLELFHHSSLESLHENERDEEEKVNSSLASFLRNGYEANLPSSSV